MSEQTTIDGQKDYQVVACEGYGPKPATFMVVGISAGKRGALLTRVPFTKDGSGRLLQRCLGRLGFSLSDEFSVKPNLVDVYMTNLVKGRILDPKGNNRLPTKKEIGYWTECRRPFPGNIWEEVTEVEPTVIVALGNLVYDALRPLFIETVKLPHPSHYLRHGGISPQSKAFVDMVTDYSKVFDMGLSVKQRKEREGYTPTGSLSYGMPSCATSTMRS